MAREFTYQSMHSLLVENEYTTDALDFTRLDECESCDNCKFAGTEECSGSCKAVTAYESDEDYAFFATEEEAKAWDEMF